MGGQFGLAGIQGAEVGPIAQIEILGRHPERAVAGDNVIAPQALEGLELLQHRLVGGDDLPAALIQGGELLIQGLALGSEHLKLTIDGPLADLPQLGGGGWTAGAAGGALADLAEGEQQLAGAHLVTDLHVQPLNLAGAPGVDAAALPWRCHQPHAPHHNGNRGSAGPDQAEAGHQQHWRGPVETG